MLCLTRFLNVPLNPLLLYPLLLLALSGINSTLFFSLFRWFLSSLFQDFILLEATISVLLKKVVLTNFVIFTGEHLCWSLLFNKIAGVQACNFVKKDFNTGVFLWILRNFPEHIFWKTLSNGCFSPFSLRLVSGIHLNKPAAETCRFV